MFMRFLIFVNDVIIASKICYSLNLHASASAQNILRRNVFRKKQILLIGYTRVGLAETLKVEIRGIEL